jgi:uncharacterized lipoprotein NlpE involved in copper resistance
MKKVLVLVFAFSLVLTGCKKEADQIMSKPLSEAQGSVVAHHTPTPSPIPTDEEYVKGAVGAGVAEYDDDVATIGRWVAVGVFSALALAIAHAIYRMCKDGGGDDAGILL